MKGRENMDNNFIVPTGRIIKEYISNNNISQKELSARLGISEKHTSNLLNGKSRLTEEVAIKLELVFKNIPAQYWLNIETKYREYLARGEENTRLMKSDLETIGVRFKFKEVFKGLDWSLLQQATEMLKILKISDYSNFEAVYSNMPVNFMEDGGDIESIAIWLNLCEQEVDVQNKNLNDIRYSSKKLEKSLSLFKKLAYNPRLEVSLNSCRKLCNELGIYMVTCEAISNSKVRGALSTYNDHPVIYLSGRFKTHDHVWFAFIHEIAHLLKHYNTNETMISFEETGHPVDIKEEEANKFSREYFIDPIDYERFVECGDFSSKNIESFAVDQCVLPGIVVARLQHDGYLPRDRFNYKK